jgi:hypothetical protein
MLVGAASYGVELLFDFHVNVLIRSSRVVS